MLNFSEEVKKINETDLNKILYDSEYEIYNVEITDNKNERMSRFKQIIKTEHMNDVEKQSISI